MIILNWSCKCNCPNTLLLDRLYRDVYIVKSSKSSLLYSFNLSETHNNLKEDNSGLPVINQLNCSVIQQLHILSFT